MKKLISLCLISLILSGCSLLQTYKLDIDQGNIFTQEDVSRLRPGMTESEVKDIMGTPMLINLFSRGRIDYVYTFQQGHKEMTEKRVTCIFQQGRLREIIR